MIVLLCEPARNTSIMLESYMQDACRCVVSCVRVRASIDVFAIDGAGKAQTVDAGS